MGTICKIEKGTIRLWSSGKARQHPVVLRRRAFRLWSRVSKIRHCAIQLRTLIPKCGQYPDIAKEQIGHVDHFRNALGQRHRSFRSNVRSGSRLCKKTRDFMIGRADSMAPRSLS